MKTRGRHLVRAEVVRAIRPELDVQRIGLGVVAGLDPVPMQPDGWTIWHVNVSG